MEIRIKYLCLFSSEFELLFVKTNLKFQTKRQIQSSLIIYLNLFRRECQTLIYKIILSNLKTVIFTCLHKDLKYFLLLDIFKINIIFSVIIVSSQKKLLYILGINSTTNPLTRNIQAAEIKTLFSLIHYINTIKYKSNGLSQKVCTNLVENISIRLSDKLAYELCKNNQIEKLLQFYVNNPFRGLEHMIILVTRLRFKSYIKKIHFSIYI